MRLVVTKLGIGHLAFHRVQQIVGHLSIEAVDIGHIGIGPGIGKGGGRFGRIGPGRDANQIAFRTAAFGRHQFGLDPLQQSRRVTPFFVEQIG